MARNIVLLDSFVFELTNPTALQMIQIPRDTISWWRDPARPLVTNDYGTADLEVSTGPASADARVPDNKNTNEEFKAIK